MIPVGFYTLYDNLYKVRSTYNKTFKMTNKTKSPSWSIDSKGWKKVGKGLLIAVAGAVLTYLEGAIPGVEFGAWTTIAYAVNSAIVNLGRKYIVSYE